jgi:hypothetical protein
MKQDSNRLNMNEHHDSENLNILAIAIMEMCRMKKGESFCPSEVVKWIYPASWEYFLEDVKREMMRLYQIGKIEVTQNQIPIPFDIVPVDEVRIKCKI